MKFSAFQSARYFLLITMVVLAVFGIGSLLRIKATPDQAFLYGFYALAMFGDAAVLMFCMLQLSRRRKQIFYLSVFILSLNVFLTIFDQVGLADLLFVVLNLTTLFAVLAVRKEFFPV